MKILRFEPRPLRAAALVALCTLGLAACNSSKEGAAPTQVAAKVNDKSEISVHQINFALQRQAGLKSEQAEAASRQILERLIDQDFAVQKATDLKIDREPAVMQALSAARRDVLARAYAERVAATAATPTPDDVKTYFEGRPNLFAQRRVYTLQELNVQAGTEQVEALRGKLGQFKSQKELSEYLLAQKLPVRASQNSTAAENLPAPLIDRLAAAKEGQALMMPAPGGVRIVLVAAARSAPVTLDQARPAIEQALLTERRRQAVDADLKAMRQAGKVEYVGKFAMANTASPTTAAAPAAPAAAASAAPAAGVDDAEVKKGLAGLK